MEVEPTCEPPPRRACEQVVRRRLHRGACGAAGGDQWVGTPYQHSTKEDRLTGIIPQLLNSIEEFQVQQFIEDPRYCAQEKYDGRRILIQKAGEAVAGINRKGLTVDLPETILGSAKAIPGDFIIDGECVGDHFYTFDMLEGPGLDLRTKALSTTPGRTHQPPGSGDAKTHPLFPDRVRLSPEKRPAQLAPT